MESPSLNPVAVFSQVHICCLAFREPTGGALKCLCELSAHDEVFRQRNYMIEEGARGSRNLGNMRRRY